MSASDFASSKNTASPPAAETASAARRRTAFRRRSLELGGDAAADDLEHGLGERDVGERRAVHDGEQAEPLAVAVAKRERGVRIHSLRREQAARLELGGEAADDVAEFAADDLFARRPCDPVLERREALAVEQRAGRPHARLRVVGEDGDESGRRAEALRHLGDEVVEQVRARRPRRCERDAVQRSRVSVPGGGLRGDRRHETSVDSAGLGARRHFSADTARIHAVTRRRSVPFGRARTPYDAGTTTGAGP
jgi:hypothetical protein